MKLLAVLVGLLFGVVVIFLWSSILALPVMWLWNALIPELFGLPKFGFWDAWQLLLLCSFLFKSHTTVNK